MKDADDLWKMTFCELQSHNCNGYAIAASTKIRKSTKVKRVSHGAR